ncbi:P22AR C-terminal domain-containing protein [Dickeya poaceiphila]|uniref:Phage repressor protein/antirepressor Ant n=1 Tax=Dickeya poaceiphila TaxID=568768 RepID=A0A5B8I9D1_9GAMM|nr:P22AR C-terminal domain-containing protein [Dickeya poaceiphila]QDX29567.1 phage repressor protein/antirepressor Ant [Dickeya poaceiphila]
MKSMAKVNADITIFKFDDRDIRVVMKKGDPWFVAADLCDALNLTNSRVSLMALDDDEKDVSLIYTRGGRQIMSVVSESGMYTLILRCRDAVKPGTVPYRVRKWVTADVLPSIRETGKYTKNYEDIEKTTVDDRTPLRSLVNRIMGKYGIPYQPIYKMIHREFGVNHIDELSPKQAAEAMDYLAAKVIEGEFLGKQSLPATPPSPALTVQEMNRLVWLWDYANRSQAIFRELMPVMQQLQSSYHGVCCDYGYEFSAILSLSRDAVLKLTSGVDVQAPSDSINISAWIRLKNNELPARLR